MLWSVAPFSELPVADSGSFGRVFSRLYVYLPARTKNPRKTQQAFVLQTIFTPHLREESLQGAEYAGTRSVRFVMFLAKT